jgi:hypothetical protein
VSLKGLDAKTNWLEVFTASPKVTLTLTLSWILFYNMSAILPLRWRPETQHW